MRDEGLSGHLISSLRNLVPHRYSPEGAAA